MSVVSQGEALTLSAQFNSPTSSVPTDPSGMQLQVLYEDSDTPEMPPVVVGPIALGGLTRTGVGAYQYTWIVPTDIDLGTYQVQWLGVVEDTPQFIFDELTIVSPSNANEVVQSAVSLSTDPHIIVGSDNISFKFDATPKAVSVYQGSYTLYKVQGASEIALDYDSATGNYDFDSAYELTGDPGATNVFIQSPFLSIQQQDYNSISRVITLYFASQLVPNAQYVLYVSGIVDVAGLTVPDAKYLFSVPAGVTASVAPTETPILVVDHSVMDTPFTSLDVITELNPNFYIVSTDPAATDVFVDPSYNDGRITIKFSSNPGSSYINNDYFFVQYKPLSRGFTRWATVSGLQVSLDESNPWVYLDMPSQDASPVHHQSGTTYYQDNYKYRVKISGSVALTNQPPYDNLEEDQFLGFLVNPAPFLVDPDVIQAYFPDASLFEISELIYDASQEVQDLFDDGVYTQPITPTIQTTMEDYVIADVCCNLDRIYGIGGVANQIEISLGDLTVNQSNPSKASVNRSNATTWCELAGVIRNEIYNLSNKSGMKAVVKGSRYWNPMPRRRIEYQEWRSWGWDRDSEWRQDWN